MVLFALILDELGLVLFGYMTLVLVFISCIDAPGVKLVFLLLFKDE